MPDHVPVKLDDGNGGIDAREQDLLRLFTQEICDNWNRLFEKALGEYHWGSDLCPPVGFCRGCREHAVFYTEDEFEVLDKGGQL